MNLLSSRSFDSDIDRRMYNRVAWRLLPYLLLLYTVSFLDKVNVGFAKIAMGHDLGLTDVGFGIGAGIFFVGYCVCEIPSNLALQRFGARIWIARIMVVWGLTSCAMMFVSNVHQFYLVRLLLGVAEAGFYPGIIYYLTFWFPARVRSQVCAFFFLGITMSGVIGAPVSGAILSMLNGKFGLSGWQWLFLIEGWPAIILGVVTFFYLDDGPSKANWLGESERARIARTLTYESRVQSMHGVHRIRDALFNTDVWITAFITFALLGNAYAVSFWLPQIVHRLGVVNPMENGLVTMIPFVVATFFMIATGRLSDVSSERRLFLVTCVLGSAAGLIGAALSIDVPALSLACIALALSGALGGMAVLTAINGVIATGRATGVGIALMVTVGNTSGYFAPVLMGWISQSTGHVEYGLLALGGITIAFLPAAFKLRIAATLSRQADSGSVIAESEL
jgi:MFS family permease